MSRELKFRCWNNASREYIPEDELMENFGEYLHEDHLYIEQYTGLKDKNGKEICEGGIVSEHNGDILGKITQRVSGEWQIEWVGMYGGTSSLYEENHMCEIIGNIHENPELLEGEK